MCIRCERYPSKYNRIRSVLLFTYNTYAIDSMTSLKTNNIHIILQVKEHKKATTTPPTTTNETLCATSNDHITQSYHMF